MASSESTPLTLSILKNYYPYVKTLNSYLLDLLSGNPKNIQACFEHEDDDISYKTFLNTSYVACKDLQKYSEVSSPVVDMREVLEMAQERIFTLRRAQNIITQGFRLSSYDGERGKRRIVNYFNNSVITAFQGSEWETLLSRIGEDAILQLLTETSVYSPLPNGCLCQITGEPIIYLIPVKYALEVVSATDKGKDPQMSLMTRKRPALESNVEDRRSPLKRVKLGSFVTTISDEPAARSKPVSPADISIPRMKLFYSKPDLIPHTQYMVVGLPVKHILNQLRPSYQGKGKTIAPMESRMEAEESRHLSKYIFARQYGLANSFQSSHKTSMYKVADYLDREAELKTAGPCKTPRRLKNVLPILEKLVRRHARCGYKPLRDRACPSKVTSGGKEIDSSTILELMSETSIQLQSQPSLGLDNTSLDSNGNPIPAFGLTQARKNSQNKPRFAEFACSHVEVYRFVASVTEAVIPKSFWGSQSNLRVILQHVKKFIGCRRYETLTVHHILQGFSTSACEWLAPPGVAQLAQTRVSVSDQLKRRELLEEFLLWYFDSFVLPLLKTTFYVTESSAFRNQVLYFRHDDWTVLCAPLIERLTSVTFERLSDLDAAEIFRQRRLGFSFVRLLPKETGVRPIVNLRRRKTVTRGSFTSEQSINQILQAAFNILTYERVNQRDRLGASVLGPDDIYLKLRRFKTTLVRDPNGALPKLYFVKVDVQACFDTIDQTRLLQILRDVITEDTYITQRYGQINPSVGRIKRAYVKKALPQDEQPHFLRYAEDLAKVLRNSIFVDQVVYPTTKKQDVLQLLEEHITENIVKIGQHYYRQMIGIPQGSVLSSILCSFFYGDLEKRFRRFTHDPQSVLLRLIDDYLYITTSLSNAKGFLDMMIKGHPEYGCFIAREKTLTNFDYDEQILNVIEPVEKTFPWCGFSINMRDLSITVDYSRYNSSGIRSTLTIDRGRRPGATFMYKLLQMAKAKSHPIYSNRDLNSEHVVYLNIYQNLILSAMKMYEYIRDWGGDKGNMTFLRNAIRRAIMYNYITVRTQGKRKGQNTGDHPEVHKEVVAWLGNHAFHHVLSRRPSQYSALVKGIEFDMKRPRFRRYFQRFKSLVKEGQASFARITS